MCDEVIRQVLQQCRLCKLSCIGYKAIRHTLMSDLPPPRHQHSVQHRTRRCKKEAASHQQISRVGKQRLPAYATLTCELTLRRRRHQQRAFAAAAWRRRTLACRSTSHAAFSNRLRRENGWSEAPGLRRMQCSHVPMDW
jgi:hypothetical protein